MKSMANTYNRFWTSLLLEQASSSWTAHPSSDHTLQIILELYNPKKELAKNRSLSHSWYSVRNYKIPKGIMKTRFEPRLPKMSSWKILNFTTWIRSWDLCKWQVFCPWTIKAKYWRFPQISISFIYNYQGLSFLPVTFTGQVQILSVIFNIFSCWYPWENRFKSGFHSSFWDFMCGIWNWGMSSSFRNHVIQISIRQVHFQDTYSQLSIVKIFRKNIYFL
jgi:hypothetical protein